MFKPHDRETQMLIGCDPYLEDKIVYTVQVAEKPEPVIIEIADTVSNGTGAV